MEPNRIQSVTFGFSMIVGVTHMGNDVILQHWTLEACGWFMQQLAQWSNYSGHECRYLWRQKAHLRTFCKSELFRRAHFIWSPVKPAVSVHCTGMMSLCRMGSISSLIFP